MTPVGAAVVASDLPPFRELLGGDGPRPLARTFPVGDAAALAAGVVAALRHPDPVTRQRARRATRRFDWSVVGAEVAEVYRSVVGPAVAGSVARPELPFVP